MSVFRPFGEPSGLLEVGASARTSAYAAREASMREHDPRGLGVTMISMGVVLSALTVLCVVFYYLGRALSCRGAARVRAAAKPSRAALVAAISMALHEHMEVSRDEEIVNITIEQISRRYSPWNSRIYGLMANRLRRG